jgi:hypothetical protein
VLRKKPHDMGGDPAGPVDRHEHTPTMTERRIDAMMLLLRQKPRAFWVTDENRRTIESLTPDTYAASGYYEKWAYAMRSLLVEKGVLTEAEIAARLSEVKARHGASPRTGRGGKRSVAKSPASKPAARKPAARRAVASRTGAGSAKGKSP